MARGDAPEAAVVLCPDCGEEQVHDVLAASGSGDGAQHATVTCRECGRTHRTVLEPMTYLEVPVIISRGDASERHLVPLPGDEVLTIEDELVAAGQQVQVRGIDRVDGKRVRTAAVKDIATLWAIHFEEILVKVAVNMGKKTISKSVPVAPRDTFTVGDEFDLDRLRIYIHAIRTPTGTLHRGTAEAKDITRLFGRPVKLDPLARKERREELGLPAPRPRRRAPRPVPEERAQRAPRPARPPPTPARRAAPGRAPPRSPSRAPARGGARKPPPRGGATRSGTGSGTRSGPRRRGPGA